MKPKTLIQTNPYLQDPVMRKRVNERSVRSSSGVEGIAVVAGKKISITRTPRELFSHRKKSPADC